MTRKFGVVIPTYNDPTASLNRCLRSVYAQVNADVFTVCVDDGSRRPVADSIDFPYSENRLMIQRIPHGERTAARMAGIEVLRDRGMDYLLFLDSDMFLPNDFFEIANAYLDVHACDAVVIPETAYSESVNYWTRVKVFERNLYQVGRYVGATSIEAARLWRMDKFPGFVPGLNAFEEIHPTLACLQAGGMIRKASRLRIYHDEKEVTLRNLLRKKGGYFKEMGRSSVTRWRSAFSRFYFFRWHLYHPKNVWRYVLHPTLSLGVFSLYVLQTFMVLVNLVRG